MVRHGMARHGSSSMLNAYAGKAKPLRQLRCLLPLIRGQLLTRLGGRNSQFVNKVVHALAARAARPSSVEDLLACRGRFLTFPFRTVSDPAYF